MEHLRDVVADQMREQNTQQLVALNNATN